VQAYEFAFNPQDGLDALNQNVRPVSAGSKPILPASASADGDIDFDLRLQGCSDSTDPVFSTWPDIQPSTGYFAVFALVSEHGVLNPACEGAVASTTD
jgi:hypothetical protein